MIAAFIALEPVVGDDLNGDGILMRAARLFSPRARDMRKIRRADDIGRSNVRNGTHRHFVCLRDGICCAGYDMSGKRFGCRCYADWRDFMHRRNISIPFVFCGRRLRKNRHGHTYCAASDFLRGMTVWEVSALGEMAIKLLPQVRRITTCFCNCEAAFGKHRHIGDIRDCAVAVYRNGIHPHCQNAFCRLQPNIRQSAACGICRRINGLCPRSVAPTCINGDHMTNLPPPKVIFTPKNSIFVIPAPATQGRESNILKGA